MACFRLWVVHLAYLAQTRDEPLGLAITLVLSLGKQSSGHLVLEDLLPVEGLKSCLASLHFQFGIVHQEELLPLVQCFAFNLDIHLPSAEGSKDHPE